MQVLIALRQDAKQNKNWTLADQIRDKLKTAGIELKDSKDGVEWKFV